MERMEFRAMGTTMLAVLDAPAERTVLEEVPAWFATWEQHLSRFRPDSELSLINSAQGTWTPASAVLWNVIEAAMQAARDTGGLVSPTLLDAVEAAGYRRSFPFGADDGGGNTAQQEGAPAVLPWWSIQRDAHSHAMRLPRGVRLDLGGIAKGWAADHAAHQLGRAGAALVDAGGDIAVSGPREDGEAWTIAVADPATPDADLALLAIHHGGIATSGRDRRRWQHGGAWQHHIVDPRTARPATTDVLSATVVAPSACAAEAAAKAALILGSRDGLAWIDARPSLAALLVLDDGQVVRSRRISRYEVV